MDSFAQLAAGLAVLNGWIWGWPLPLLMAGAYLFLTFRLGVPQRHLLRALSCSFSKNSEGKGDLGQLKALSVAVASAMGTGSLAGVAAALLIGGPGALFWMWLAGLVGMSAKYAEALLAVKYRFRTRNGTLIGGAMCTLEYGMRQRWLAVIFCGAMILTALGIGAMVQANTAAAIVKDFANVDAWVTGVCLAVFFSAVIVGGIGSIGKACEKLVPFTLLFSILCCAAVIILNLNFLFPAIRMILATAFTGHAAAGGIAGTGALLALRHGIAQGPFTNESGFGEASIAAAAGRTLHPVRSALVASTGTFWHMTVFSGFAGLALAVAMCSNPALYHGLNGPDAVQALFSGIPSFGRQLFFVNLLLFVVCAVLGWSLCVERAVEYLFHRKAVPVFRYFWILAIFLGSLDNVPFMPVIREVSITSASLMAAIGLVSIVVLSGVASQETKEYFFQKNGAEKNARVADNAS